MQLLQSPDTANLENVGKNEKGENMNPLNAQVDSIAVLTSESPVHQHGGGKTGKIKRPAPLKIKHVRQWSRDDVDSPLRGAENGGRRTPFESPLHRNAGDSTPRRASRHGDRSLEFSPLHPARIGGGGGRGGAGVSSPTWERKGLSEGGRPIAPSTPSRSRLRPVTKGDDTPDHNLVIPKFGDWDDMDPSSAEQFSQVFDRVRDEKQSEAGKVPVMPTEIPDLNNEKQLRNESSKGCSCFPWLGK
ncbi:unnamed protein product [Cuscuta epithymum]|uniref:RIN4 pathogenic type III effector avirulence factor Avr cleavage site domain-containing protein n=2 Tax=Cuscuta epithymum TaxID=186058 RepID=A0AAV0C866_9ASTE|nr:unnamed protein product [Cuscuta epithymum]